MVIRNFEDQAAEDLFNGRDTKAARRLPKSLWKSAGRKLEMLDTARSLAELAALPGNRLEKLHGDLANSYSIRINDQFRVIFRWENVNAFDVWIADYH
jgi:proteic killer suppression protein